MESAVPGRKRQAPCWAEINTVEHGVEDGSNIRELFPVGIVAISSLFCRRGR
jgi:hypothetical protein